MNTKKEGRGMYPKKLRLATKPEYPEQYVFASCPRERVMVYRENEHLVGMHLHDFYEMILILSGNGCHYIGDMQVPLHGGEVFVIPPGVSHGFYCEKGAILRECYLLFSNDFMREYSERILSVPGGAALFELEPYLRRVYDAPLFLRLPPKELEAVERRIDAILSVESGENNPYREFAVLHFVGDLCLAMKRAREHSKGDGDDYDRDILFALEYIRAHFTEKITVEDLMRATNLSRPTLHRRFRAMVQCSPMEYLIRLRLNAVKKMEGNADLTRTDLAQKCGFYDASHMNRCQKREQARQNASPDGKASPDPAESK